MTDDKKPEPVAWRWKYKFPDIGETGAYEYHSHEFACVANLPCGEALYAEPPRREWIGLTDEEVGTFTVFDGLNHVETPILAEFIRMIEAALKAKNT